MKRLSLLAVFCVSALVGFSQTKKTPPPKPKPTGSTSTNTLQLKNPTDSFSYAIGVSIANFYREQGVKNLNSQLVLKGLQDANSNSAKMDEQAINNCIVEFMQDIRAEKASGNKKAGQEFLAQNKTKPGVVTTESGLQYQVIKEGTGPKPVDSNTVKVHYHGTLIDGFVFDSSVQRGEPIEFGVTGVIPGWTEALKLMPVGSKWKLFVPSDLAYGDNQAGPNIGPGSTLIFEVELLDIVR